MRLLILAAAHDVHTTRWCNGLSQAGHDIFLCFSRNHAPSIDAYDATITFIPLAFPSPFGYYLNALHLKQIIKKVKPDIIHAHYASGYGTLARIVKAQPLVLTVYGSDVFSFPYQSKRQYRLIEKNLTYANAITSSSLAMANHVENLIGTVQDLRVIPFGVDTNLFQPWAKDKKSSTIQLTTIKKLNPIYGIRYAILAMDELINKRKIVERHQIHYTIYGDGKEEKQLKNLVKELKLTDVISFKGRIPHTDVPDILNESDIFIAPSIVEESFGVAVIEAMAMAIPVIVTDALGFIEVTDHGECGIIVPKENPNEIADALTTLLSSASARQCLGEKGRTRTITHYDWKTNIKTMIQLYEELHPVTGNERTSK